MSGVESPSLDVWIGEVIDKKNRIRRVAVDVAGPRSEAVKMQHHIEFSHALYIVCKEKMVEFNRTEKNASATLISELVLEAQDRVNEYSDIKPVIEKPIDVTDKVGSDSELKVRSVQND